MWLPLIDGIARIGVLHVTADRLTPALLDGARQLAAVTALTIVSKSGFSDLISRTSRQRPISTAAEMVWAFLPPRTLGTDRVTSTAVLEPAYEIGGDAFDHKTCTDGSPVACSPASSRTWMSTPGNFPGSMPATPRRF